MDNSQKERIFCVARYLDIVQTIISEKKDITIIKLIIISFLMKNFDYKECIFRKNTKKYLSSLIISLLENSKTQLFFDLEFIFCCLNILNKNNKIEIVNGRIKNIDCGIYLSESEFRVQLYDAISEYSDKNILREVLFYV